MNMRETRRVRNVVSSAPNSATPESPAVERCFRYYETRQVPVSGAKGFDNVSAHGMHAVLDCLLGHQDSAMISIFPDDPRYRPMPRSGSARQSVFVAHACSRHDVTLQQV